MTMTTNSTGDARAARIPKGPKLCELAGMDDARIWGERLQSDIEAFQAGQIRWRDVDPGCVLHGAPGTGKTTFAKALAASCKLPLIATSFADWQGAGEGHLGTLLSSMEETFAEARLLAPAILFIDELDSIPRRGTGAKETTYWNQVTNALLKAIDGLGEVEGVVVIGACNHPNLLDPALVRSCRMDRQIEIQLPDSKAIETILAFHLATDEVKSLRSSGVGPEPLPRIARLCTGMAGADIAKLVREARARARHKRRALSVDDFLGLLDAVSGLPPEYLRRIAVHEAGHAVAAFRFGLADEIALSIAGRAESGGRASLRLANGPLTRDLLERRIVMLLAGRAAEEVFFGDVSAGAGGGETSDLGQATTLALEAVARLGLSSQSPLAWHGSRSSTDRNSYPLAVQAEVDAMLSKAYGTAVLLVQHEWDFVNLAAEALLRERALAHRDFVRLDRRPHDERHRLAL